ncbi:FecR/PupR family sigma factor regulator, partial [Ottowia sp.]|uniref:FecR/PupR family sigma factor regulator n=1 Tax=Ottowia sp. TaxID=1898956 RepID=UPI0039E6947E
MDPAAPRNSDAPCCDARQDEAEARASAEFIASQDPMEAAAAGWLVRRQDGLSPEEEAELQSWLAADPAHAEALARMQEVWGSIGELPGESIESLRAGLPPVQAGMAAPAARPAAAAPDLPPPRRRAPPWPRPAPAAWLAWPAGPGRLA